MGGITSASREAMRPVSIVSKLSISTIRCTKEAFAIEHFYRRHYSGPNPGKIIPYVMNKWGKKIYTLAADYIYGQTTAKWVKKYCVDNGGEILATDFFPLDVTNFGPTIAKIQAAKPDIVMSVLVGGAHISFYRQWSALWNEKTDSDGIYNIRDWQ